MAVHPRPSERESMGAIGSVCWLSRRRKHPLSSSWTLRIVTGQKPSLDGKCITSLGEQPGGAGRERALTMREYPVGNQAMPHRGLAPPTTISPAPWGGIGAAY